MNTGFLDQLAHQLRTGKSPPCRRAINRILEDIRKRWENGEYADPTQAEAALREVVEAEGFCQKSTVLRKAEVRR
jgi:hypothetical protein